MWQINEKKKKFSDLHNWIKGDQGVKDCKTDVKIGIWYTIVSVGFMHPTVSWAGS